MNSRCIHHWCQLPLIMLAVLLMSQAVTAAFRPNVVVILADDMGFSDLGCYGGEIETPNLDRLAENGLRFTQFYNTARCCPTRASLLTGLYPHQVGVGHMTRDMGLDGYRGDLNKTGITIAEALRPAGYRNYMLGKWHVTRHSQPNGLKHNWPRQRGFDRFYGTITGAGSYFDPGTLTRDDEMISPLADKEYSPETYYYTDALSDHAVRFVSEHVRDHSEKPFFLYLAYTAAHWPLHALAVDIEKQKGKYDAGYDAIRSTRFEKSKALGVIDPRWSLTPTKGVWSEVEHKQWELRGMEVYAAMIDSMDQGIGRLVDELKRSGQFDNTLILFLQDNGGCAEDNGRSATTVRGEKPILPTIPRTDVLTVVTPKQTRDGWPTLTGPTNMPGPRDTYMAYGDAWANVSNTPFREYKHWVHEGGISTPLIAHWPDRIHDTGALRHQPGHVIDIMATAIDIAGATYPNTYQGHPIRSLEGRSLVSAFDSKPIDRDALFWEHEGSRALRVSQWKIVAKGPSAPWELYDLEADRTETHDLASSDSDRVKLMVRKWETIAQRTGAIPWIWTPQYEQPVE